MPILHLVILAAVQGITEFLPVSSSAHLILAGEMMGRPPEAGLIMDIAVHVGSLGAVMLYLWKDIAAIFGGLIEAFRFRGSRGLKLLGLMIIGTLPLIIAGFVIHEFFKADYETYLRTPWVIAWASIGFGILLYMIDKTFMTVNKMEHLGVFSALLIGLSQVLAFIPGTSRSGITMTAARLLGYERSDAARFSMLLSIPAILASAALPAKDLYEQGSAAAGLGLDALIAGGLSFVFAFVAIILMMAWLKRATFTIFVVYRILLGIAIIVWLVGWGPEILTWVQGMI